MTHNDVARRTAPEMPARRLIPRTAACDSQASFVDVAQRAIVRALPLRTLRRDGGGRR
ncbi:hypothetical protein ACFRAR_31660 [Kitasatospora sp. NPDC056651]|uniref:hypothetical protein n=1 Tax=Kitasatospora sp. NPDC056651 TaxID=3345892 RepID=UPI0036B1465B